jgi:hypothetical protein
METGEIVKSYADMKIEETGKDLCLECMENIEKAIWDAHA